MASYDVEIIDTHVHLDLPMMFHVSDETHAEGIETIRRLPKVWVQIMRGNEEQLTLLLDDTDWYVRWTAAKALERLWENENVEPLRRAARDENRLVAIAATETLSRKALE